MNLHTRISGLIAILLKQGHICYHNKYYSIQISLVLITDYKWNIPSSKSSEVMTAVVVMVTPESGLADRVG